jgi:hypothetical protein
MDQCGNSCGSCDDDETCTEDFQCLNPQQCLETCGDKLCGQNDCGTSCGTCEGDLVCTPTGLCWDSSVTPIARHGQLSVSGNKIVDESGAVTQLKGVSTQWLNWEQAYSTSASAMLWMRDNWALSLFRIANGVENSSGYLEAPEARLEVVKGIIENAIANEVYVISWGLWMDSVRSGKRESFASGRNAHAFRYGASGLRGSALECGSHLPL